MKHRELRNLENLANMFKNTQIAGEYFPIMEKDWIEKKYRNQKEV